MAGAQAFRCVLFLWLLVCASASAGHSSTDMDDHEPTAPVNGSVCQSMEPSPSLEPFVDELTTPPVIDISDGLQVTLGAYVIKQKLHRDLPVTTMYAYGTSQETASSPGPTLQAKRGVESYVRWENHISHTEHFLTVDDTIHWAKPLKGGVPMVTHLHGGEVLSESDGYPDAWYTSSGDVGPSYTTMNYTYANSQPPTLLWYHDHTVGITRLNMLAGLNGMYVIRSPGEEPQSLPSGHFEKLLVIQDKQLHEDGSINFPAIGVSPGVHPSWCPEYYGDVILVNGKAWPYMNVYPTKYRFRMVNAANARYFVMSLSVTKLRFIQLGTDGGFLHKRRLLKQLTIGPAERIDFIIDFGKVEPGMSVYLNNSGNAPYPGGDPVSPTASLVMKLNVIAPPENMTIPNPAIPKELSTKVHISTAGVIRKRMTLAEFDDGKGNPIGSLINNLRWRDPVTETPQLNTTEVWEIINLTEDAHPIHVHLISFLVRRQQSFDTERQAAGNCTFDLEYPDPQSCYSEYPQGPEKHHLGWKDTATVYPAKVTTFVLRWTTQTNEPFTFDATIGPGYVWHCHILDHEDNDMMRQLKILPAKTACNGTR